MKLSQDIIYYRLLQKYPAQFFNRCESGKKYGYPVIYEAGAELSDHVVVIGADEFEALPAKADYTETMFVCIGALHQKELELPSVIMIEENVSPIRINNYLIQTFDEFENWRHDLRVIVRKCGSFQDMLNSSGGIISEQIAIIDRDLKIVAECDYAKQPDGEASADEGMSPENFDAEMNNPDRSGIAETGDSHVFPFATGCNLGRDMVEKDTFVGRIAIHLRSSEEHLQYYYNAVLDLLYNYIVELYHEAASFEAGKSTNARLGALLRYCLNNKKISDKLWEEAFRENGWDVNGTYLLVQFIPNTMKEYNVRTTYSKVLEFSDANPWSESLAFIYTGRLLMCINIDLSTGNGKPNIMKTIADFAKSNLLVAGISSVFSGMKHLRSAYEQTKTAIEYGTANHPADSCFRFDNYALGYMLHNCVGTFENEEICSGKLVLLQQFDKEKGTEYFNTLCTYFKCKFNAAEAAKQLFINRSTFHYRLERIQELVNIHFDSADELLYLALSYKILEQ